MVRRLCVALGMVLILAGQVQAEVNATGYIAPDTIWETPYYVFDSGVPGPVVVITGGVHGDEPAGALAALEMLDWTYSRGVVVIVPQVNLTGLELGTRKTVGDGYCPETDINRSFPIDSCDMPAHPVVRGLWDLFATIEPEWVFDLHEGTAKFIQEPEDKPEKSVGQTIIVQPDYWAEHIASSALDVINRTLKDDERFLLIGFFKDSRGQLVRGCTDHLGSRGMIIETVSSNQPVALRVEQHRIIVHKILSLLGVVSQALESTAVDLP